MNKKTNCAASDGLELLRARRDEARHLADSAPDLLIALETALRYLRDPKFDPAMRGAQAFLIEAAIYRAKGDE